MQARGPTAERQLDGAPQGVGAVTRDPVPPVPILELPPAVLGRIERAAARGYPLEVCGLLLGRRHPEVVRVQRAVRLRNLAVNRRADRYVLDPQGFLKVDLWVRSQGLDIVGVWHSHPDSPAQPSETDRQWGWPAYAYLIVAVRADGVRETRSWELQGASFREQFVQTDESFSGERRAP